MIEAVFFDFDGVVVASMENHARAWQKTLARYGIAMTIREVFLQEGRPTTDVAREFLRRNGLPGDDDASSRLAAEKQNYYLANFHTHTYPETVAILQRLHEMDVPLGLVTGSRLATVSQTIPPALQQLFRVIVTADDVVKGKPSPEPYQKAASALGIAPELGLVVENAPLGIAAAKAAGMRVIAMTTTLSAADLYAADEIATNFQELENLLLSKRSIPQPEKTV